MAKRRAQRRYSDEERSDALLALAANAGNLEQTARELDIPRKTLASWAAGTSHPEAASSCQEKKAPLADRLEALAHNLVGDLDAPGGRALASYRDKSRTLGIAVDKMQLLRGRPTSITSLDVSGMSDDDLDREITRLQGTPLPAPAREEEAGGNGVAR